MEESIILVVKAPNQQIDDQTINCEMSWTIKRLKGHLSEVYPSKPRFEDQKLIYSGQLLNDNSTLKEVLRVYEGQENHTVHLVCSPTKESLRAMAAKKTTPTTPSPQPAAQEGSSSGPPPAPAPSSSTEGLRQRHVYPSQQWPFTLPTGTPAPVWPVPGAYDSASLAQQMAWMQQAYAQYMTQYMQLMASGNVPPGVQMPTPMPAAPHQPAPLREDPAPANEPAPNNEEEERANRDWLDWFYIVSRLLVLFSIVYFYSSPVRFFVVSTLGVIMYLYQVGFFRAVQRLDQAEEVAENPPPTPDNNNAPPPAPQVPSPLAVAWAAFSSFFLSLIPEQPNVL